MLQFYSGPPATREAAKGEATAISSILHLVFYYSPTFAAHPNWRKYISLEDYPVLKMAYRVYRARGGVSNARVFVGEAICCTHRVCIYAEIRL